MHSVEQYFILRIKDGIFEEALKIAAAAAACNISEANSIDGMKNIDEVRRIFDTMPKMNL